MILKAKTEHVQFLCCDSKPKLICLILTKVIKYTRIFIPCVTCRIRKWAIENEQVQNNKKRKQKN